MNPLNFIAKALAYVYGLLISLIFIPLWLVIWLAADKGDWIL